MQQNCTKAKELSVSLASVTQSRHRTSVKGSSTFPSGVCRGARTEAMPRERNNDGEEGRASMRGRIDARGAPGTEPMVPKPGLYRRGLLKSLTIWAIPLFLLHDRRNGHSSLFVSLPRSPAHCVAPANTYLTPTSDPRSAPLPGIVSTNVPRRNSVHKSRRRWQVPECSHDLGGWGDGGWYRSHDTGCLPLTPPHGRPSLPTRARLTGFLHPS